MITDNRRYKLVTEPKYQILKNYLPENLLPIKMNKTNFKMNKSVYLGRLISGISKIAMYKCWYDYLKPDYGKMAKLSYRNTDKLVVHVKQKTPTQTLLEMLRSNLTHVTLKLRDHYP